MAAMTSFASPSGKAEREATRIGSRDGLLPHTNSSCKDPSRTDPSCNGAASSHLSEQQKKLLAGFGVLSSGHLQRRLMSISLENARQDRLPPHPSNHKGVTTASFSPTFIQLPPNIHSQDKASNMAPFDPLKYGAPPKKQGGAGPGQNHIKPTKPAESEATVISPPLIQPQPNISSQNKASNMTPFNPSKYGAPPNKQGRANGRRNQSRPVKPTESNVSVPGLTSAPVPDQTPTPVASVTVSEVSHHTISVRAQATGIANTAKTGQVKALKPEPGNNLSVSTFDPTKYGMPKTKLNRSLARDEATVKTDIAASSPNIQTSHPPATITGPSLPHKQFLASTDPVPHVSRESVEHDSSFGLSTNVVNKDNNFSNNQSPVSNDTVTNSTAPAPRKFPKPSKGPSNNMLTASLQPCEKVMSKEERLQYHQQAALRKIGSRNRHKGDAPETTSVRDLQIARDTTSLECPSAATATAMSTMEHSQVNVASNRGTSQAARPQRDPSIPKARFTIPPVLPGTSKEDLLKQVQQASLRSINMRNRGDWREPETTSLVDLNLARTPIQSGEHVSAAVPSPLAQILAAESSPPQTMPASTTTTQLNTGEIRPSAAASITASFPGKTTRNSKWCTNEELRPEPNMESTSNTWGSDIPGTASVASCDSLRPMQLHGRLFKGPAAGDNDEIKALVGWDGKMQPPPVDWNDRPSFNNNSPAFKNGFNNWFAVVAAECYNFVDRTPMFKTIPYHLVLNTEWHADGLGMTRREFTLNAHNLSRYGYNSDPADVAKYAEEITVQEYEDWAKLDMREAENVKFKDETTEQLVKTWISHQKNPKKTVSLAAMPGHKPTKESKAPKLDVKLNEPSLNIYLRPAVDGDMEQLTELYNWWVQNSARPAEVRSLGIGDMRWRFDNTQDDRLPFVVAILKGKKDVRRDHYTGVKPEQVVGFACAVSLSTANLVEHIAAELEVYVHHQYLRQGIGKCLVDRLMCATDRGYMEQRGYTFHCDPTERHWYEVGGARDLHKVVIVARHYSRAKTDCPEELAVTTWLKKWLVKEWDFEHEACLKQAGAKNGRFLDLEYFTKFSKWLPEDGRVPDPQPRDHARWQVAA